MTILKKIHNEDFNLVLSYDARIETFNQSSLLAESSGIDVKKLAEYGFYSTSTDEELDSITCCVCLNSFTKWLNDEDPLMVHYQMCTDCPLTNLKKVYMRWTVKDIIDFNYYRHVSRLKFLYDKEIENKKEIQKAIREKIHKMIDEVQE